ncbi:hypothetical protein AB0M44_21095 [Streptosporangium subroseum]|jgi:hypothetical protein|uniref:Uncharacterized protein n=1 Tax=Streptosporangium subroseum TaxID=106412 RepID=A0A239MWM3_9ACTN|nr:MULTISPECIES: hypothetical protein [Streptosporangium]AWS41058.1 hypothetical protein DKM19_06475 [Streptosporangium sp. 'caverna']WSA15571.1 hypothetical protein OHB15_38925 [Streptosporangium subroseum]SNT47131.1 hypothetical protein SAMN05216276_104743 [Streptosporangium subroseum]
MSDESGTERYLRLTVELTVEVQDLAGLQAAALKEINHPDADLDDDERKEQAELVSTDDTGATALQWLIEPDHVLGLIEHVEEIEPREAVLGVEPSDGPSDEDEDEEHDHDHDAVGHKH